VTSWKGVGNGIWVNRFKKDAMPPKRKDNVNFVVILEDSLFDTKVGVLDKDRGMTIAQKLDGKIKVG